MVCRYCERKSGQRDICDQCLVKLMMIRRIQMIGRKWLKQREVERHAELLRQYRKIWRDSGDGN